MEATKEINVMELLIKISNDVSSIKTDMENLKKNQAKDNADVRADCQRDIEDLEKRMITKINNIQSVQNTLVGDVDTLKHAEEAKDAKRWRTVIAFVGTALGGMLVAKLPDIVRTLIIVLSTK